MRFITYLQLIEVENLVKAFVEGPTEAVLVFVVVVSMIM